MADESAQTIDLVSQRARYDECAKKLLTYKAIIAWILKFCAKEFSPYSVHYICENCLKEKPEISKYAVHQDHKDQDERLDGDTQVEGLNTEANSVSERTVYYDIRFRAVLPEAGEAVQFIINLEIQLNDTPGYPIVTRGFYYCSRMISGQYGTVFTGEHYEKLQKVYSIWICPDPAKKRRNGIFRYYTKEKAILGSSGVDQTAYDLMEVVVLNLGDAEENSQQEVLNLLNILFSVNVTPVEKKRRLQEEFSIAMTREFEGEVENMCNLSQGLVEYGIERGIERGMKRGIEKGELKKVREVAISLAETGMPVEKISELVKVSVKIVCEWLAEKS